MSDTEKTLKEIVDEARFNNKYLNKEFLNMNKEDEPIRDFMETTEEDYEEFDTRAWSKKDGYSFTNFPEITKGLEGLEEGLYLIAGESNSGKSAMMMNMLYDLCSNRDNKLFGIYYSLDDTKYDIIPRIIAMDQLIPIGAASKPQRYQNMIDNGEENSIVYEDYLEKRKRGIENLKGLKEFFKIEDSERIKTADDIFNHMQQLQAYVRTIDEDMNIVVAIDAVDDIRFTRSFSSTTDRHSETAKVIKDWTKELHIPIFGSRHLTKLKQNRRPTLDDLKDFLVA